MRRPPNGAGTLEGTPIGVVTLRLLADCPLPSAGVRSTGVKPHLKVYALPGQSGATVMQGLDSLAARLEEYKKARMI